MVDVVDVDESLLQWFATVGVPGFNRQSSGRQEEWQAGLGTGLLSMGSGRSGREDGWGRRGLSGQEYSVCAVQSGISGVAFCVTVAER